MFKEMERAAQRLTQNIGYRGAGTVEYLFNPETNKFFFLELNPRLQVKSENEKITSRKNGRKRGYEKNERTEKRSKHD